MAKRTSVLYKQVFSVFSRPSVKTAQNISRWTHASSVATWRRTMASLERRLAGVQAAYAPDLEAMRAAAVAASPVAERPSWWNEVVARFVQPSAGFADVLFLLISSFPGTLLERIEAGISTEMAHMTASIATFTTLPLPPDESSRVQSEVLPFIERSLFADTVLENASLWSAFSIVSLSKWDHDFGQSAGERALRASLFPAMTQLLVDLATDRFGAAELKDLSTQIRNTTKLVNRHAKSIFYLRALRFRLTTGLLPGRAIKPRAAKRDARDEPETRAKKVPRAEGSGLVESRRNADMNARVLVRQTDAIARHVDSQRSLMLRKQATVIRRLRAKRMRHLMGEVARERAELASGNRKKIRVGRRRRDRKRALKQNGILEQIVAGYEAEEETIHEDAAKGIAEIEAEAAQREKDWEVLRPTLEGAELRKAERAEHKQACLFKARIATVPARVEAVVGLIREMRERAVGAARRIIEDENNAVFASRAAASSAPLAQRTDEEHLNLQLSSEALRVSRETAAHHEAALAYAATPGLSERFGPLRDTFELGIVVRAIAEERAGLRASRERICFASFGPCSVHQLVEYRTLHDTISATKLRIESLVKEFNEKATVTRPFTLDELKYALEAWLASEDDDEIELL